MGKSLRRAGLLLGWLVVWGYILIWQLGPAWGAVTHGFVGHYTAARLLISGDFGPAVYDDDWFAGQVQTYTGPAVYEIFTPNLPTVALLALPLAGLPPQVARDAWLVVSLAALLATCGVLVGVGLGLGQSPEASGWILLVGLIALLPAVGANLAVGQTYLVLGGLLALALLGLVYRRDGLVGGSLGLAFILKTSGLFLWVVPLLHGRWRVLLWGGGTILLVAVFSLPWLGFDTWLAYPAAVSAFSRRGALAVPAYQTTTGLLTHLFSYDPQWNPAPVKPWPFLANVLPSLIRVVSLGATIWIGRRSDSARLFAALLPLTIVLLPVAEEYHFVLLLSSIFVVTTDLLRRPVETAAGRIAWLALGVALLLLIAPIPFKSTGWAIGWWALVAYPRLYGAWLVWAVALWGLSPRLDAHSRL
ncbi:MAG: DUF2029 domain-containing protein [Anaerolineae bacterium]|nr:DUF2029 domain-containing protein [Anaerolineae bacterium]